MRRGIPRDAGCGGTGSGGASARRTRSSPWLWAAHPGAAPAPTAHVPAPTAYVPAPGAASVHLSLVVTRLSNFFLRTLREDPAGAEVASHRLLIRAGYIRPQAAGIFAWLPLGLRVKARIAPLVAA